MFNNFNPEAQTEENHTLTPAPPYPTRVDVPDPNAKLNIEDSQTLAFQNFWTGWESFFRRTPDILQLTGGVSVEFMRA